jgi:hypothetical protein
MWKPSRPSRPSEWLSSALAVLALLVFATGGAWGYQQWEDQKTRDDRRTSQLIGCLEAAHQAADTTAATNVCLHDYADRVPALRRDNPSALVVPRTPASATPLLDATSAADASAAPPTYFVAHTTGAENSPDLGRSEDDPAEPSEVAVTSAAEPEGQPADAGKPEQPPAAQPSHPTNPPKAPAATSASSGGSGTTPAPPGTKACNRHDRDQGLCEKSSATPSARP